MDVRLEDILNAPSSLSVSLRTATELMDNSYLKSDMKKSQYPGVYKVCNNANDSYLVYQDEASMIKEATDDEEDDRMGSHSQKELLRYVLRGKNQKQDCNAINILDEENTNEQFGESQYSNLSKTLNADSKNQSKKELGKNFTQNVEEEEGNCENNEA